VLSALLALALAAPPSIWVVARASDDPRCTGEALARAVQALLPDAQVRVGARTAATDLEVELREAPGGFTLSVAGGPAPFTRELPEQGSGQCVAAVNLSALIVSRDLDELPWRASTHPPLAEAPAEPPPPAREPSTRFVADLGVVASRMAGGISPGLTLDLGLRAGLFFAALGGDLLLAQHPSITASAAEGTWVVQSDPLRAVVGLSLRFGPGNAQFGAGGGALLTSVSVRSTELFRKVSGFAAEPFLCLSAGYALALPGHLFVALRFEERWVPGPTRFFIGPGTSSSEPAVQTPTFAGALSLLVGREFF
jgi:hypothetical protein